MGDGQKTALTMEQAEDFIERGAWTFAKSMAAAPHEYVILGWDRDDLTKAEFVAFCALVREQGRPEVWTPPAAWANAKPQRHKYLYVGEYAYWVCWPALNREHVSVQEASPTRRVVEKEERG